MSKLVVGKVYTRNNFDKPEVGFDEAWKSEVIRIEGNKVVYKVVEYNGEKLETKEITMDIHYFMERYE